MDIELSMIVSLQNCFINPDTEACGRSLIYTFPHCLDYFSIMCISAVFVTKCVSEL